MAKRKSLGRGLDALLGSQISAVERSTESELRNLPVEQIRQSPYQPRATMNPTALKELADSIRVQGVVQPIVVRSLDDENYFEIIAGERRWRAAQSAGLSEIPAVVRDVPDGAVIAIALIENIQREGLNPIEEATALRRLIYEFDMTHQTAAEAVGKSRTAVTNLLRLLDLNPDVEESLRQGHLDMGHARALLGLDGPLQSQAAQQVVAKKLSARETEHLVRRLKTKMEKKSGNSDQQDPDVRQLELDLSERLGAEVQVQHGTAGSGKLVIRYTSLDQLDGIVARVTLPC
uniref:Probable chromosome-partitioning protein ParB n=1 Tax=Candidatus Kentrum eta TaxID=2126337 RepID=A0A450VC08_9GAMM|nr:MAG: chromosome partitioning protein, ParB family [Candidatus Kentron sp. H]VFK03310.1 MAG: chromosome partitioning protein, ParB family [Candidatus Kentron sp. H]VFK03635.1 MAG: chromosome partitioning protein, ParB family [Candidatus Kentron sp. H]